ncbi:MAG: YbhB/YbcL family Raf kinase inhibitor-like protein [Verrucomicrobia bacterium]|nr:YbhB/YbcL family Raf kinase inhibitor-like protein [Verrucomicrobiota bacterium]MBV8377251.1 YbhB/YbcL family Raf kinase inhibitor-like protein [Verrucomicrobiota bacterium]
MTPEKILKPLIIVLGCFLALGSFSSVEGGEFRLVSSQWREGGTVPRENLFNGSGCQGANISPEIHWSGAPAGTRSFAITMVDPDAPAPGGWWHWVAWNIPGTVSGLPAGAGNKGSKALPASSVQCKNDYGELGYGGPCPPPGTTHHYVLRIYALSLPKLSPASDQEPAKVARLIEEHSIGVAQLTMKFGR